MAIDIRLVSVEQTEEFLLPIRTVFGQTGSPERTERARRLPELDTRIAAMDGARIIGSAGSFAFDFSTPGGHVVPTAGLTMVAVMPTHRRKGVLREMMRKHLDETRGRGQPIAALWASEAPIYGRYGYGVASFAGDISLEVERSAFTGKPAPYEARLVDESEAQALIPAIYECTRSLAPGMPSRSPIWWSLRRLGDNPATMASGAGPLQRVVMSIDGCPDAYALYRLRFELARGSQIPTANVSVVEAVGASTNGTRAIWRYLADIDLAARVDAQQIPVDHPLFLMLAEPRRLHYSMYDALWVRIVDVPAALAARTYGARDTIVLDIEDDFCPWTAGRYRLDAGESRATRTNESPDLVLKASALGSAYLGGVSFTRLAEAGDVEARTYRALERADRIFASPRAPWCPEVF